MRIVLVLTMASVVVGCSSRPRVPPLTPAQQAQQMCAQIGYPAGSAEHTACAERMLAKIISGDALERAAEASRPRPAFVPMQYAPMRLPPPPVFAPPPRLQTTCTRVGNTTYCN